MCGPVRLACAPCRRVAWRPARRFRSAAVRTAAHDSFVAGGCMLAASARSGRPGPPASDRTGISATLDRPHQRHRGPARPGHRRGRPRSGPGAAAPRTHRRPESHCEPAHPALRASPPRGDDGPLSRTWKECKPPPLVFVVIQVRVSRRRGTRTAQPVRGEDHSGPPADVRPLTSPERAIPRDAAAPRDVAAVAGIDPGRVGQPVEEMGGDVGVQRGEPGRVLLRVPDAARNRPVTGC